MQPLISVVIPNYNEAENVKRGALTQLLTYLKKQSYSFEVIISDDGSTDNSLTLIKNIAKKSSLIHILTNVHAGKPFALKAGINAAKGDFVLLTDMDQSTPIPELSKLLTHTKNYKIVIGSRGVSRTDSSLLRKMASIIFLTIRRLILLPEIRDTQCGFKLIKTDLAKQIFARMRVFGRDNKATGWKVTAYDVEMLYLAKKMGQTIKEVRVNWRNIDTSSGKSRNFLKESIEMFLEILRVRVNDILGKY